MRYKKDDNICNPCFDALWGKLLYQYRISINAQMPPTVRNRPNCWYGNQCRTQLHKLNHAEKFNHICEKTQINS